MLRRESRGERLGSLIALAMLPLAAIATYAMTTRANGHTHLQQIADEAAIAGVHALAASDHATAAGRQAATSVAARRAIGDRSATIRSVTPSADRMSVSIEIVDPATKAEATATARYLPPGVRPAGQQAAAISGRASPVAHRF
ncbi:hypothetical protein [Rhodopseudomonas palustris]|uniref:hypothetical protein n=1 Tax=Rhodopseudomonas palustris TaxID=1076 RepID=UPI0011C34CA9|nr:hypothetical protein [Rhodopseudomonas palustris]